MRAKRCRWCGDLLRANYARRFCSRICNNRASNDKRATGRDPERRRISYAAKNKRRRARLHGVATESYTLTEIAKRDRQRCGLCSRKVNMTLRHPHRRSPSIDHIVPISAGGDDVRANVQLAHLICNIRKRTGGSQQLALIGLVGEN